ncbi:MAG TPA: c-type cytochrome [Bryobacteraceae bacterium]|nr:c-type cytochrome [Bryobacteraceae bacterium]
MKLGSMRLIPSVAATAILGLGLVGVARSQATAKPQMAEDVFKNIQVLKGIPVDDFLGTMGIMSGSVGFDCSECHTAAGTDKVDWAADTPKKVMARKMVRMVAAINKDNFSGRQMVTCWTCHRGRDHPAATEALATVYGPGPEDPDDVVVQAPGQPEPSVILDKYIQALGGAQKLSGLTSFVATGTSIGFGGFGGGGVVHIYAKAPDQRTTLIEFEKATGRDDSVRTYNGHTGWVKTPLTILGEYEVTGGELDGTRMDALLSFPGQIKQVLTDLRVSNPTTISDLPGPSSQTAAQAAPGIGQDRDVNVVQGTGPRGLLVTLYFDKQSGLLLRVVRANKTPIGRINTQIDFADYREVNGVKFPCRLIFAWMDGRDAIQLDRIETNVPISEKKFGRPTTVKEQ